MAQGMAAGVNPQQGEVWEAQLNPVLGRELMKPRPVIVVSASILERHALRIVVPLTTAQPKHRRVKWMVHVPRTAANGLDADSTADPHQIRTLDVAERFRSKRGEVEPEIFTQVMNGLFQCLGLPIILSTPPSQE
jgi:mRNA interferase MazF